MTTRTCTALTGRHDVTHAAASDALRATARFRGTPLTRLSSVIDNLVELRDRTYAAYRIRLGVDGEHLPERLGDVVAAVTTFAGPLVEDVEETRVLEATRRRWTTPRG